MEGKYLSELLDTSQFIKGTANLIIAPCGSGKTTAVFERIVPLANSLRYVVYLINSISGRENLLKRDETCNYNELWPDDDLVHFEELQQENKIVVMTYAKFGVLAEKHQGFIKKLELVICDEIHTLPQMMVWERPSTKPYAKIAYEQIFDLCCSQNDEQLLVFLTATPDTIINKFSGRLNLIKIDQTLIKHYTEANVLNYRNINEVIKSISKEKQSICYIERIGMMKEVEEFAKSEGHSTLCLWSIHNSTYPITDEQRRVMDYIIENEVIPRNINLLFINKSFETSINIRNVQCVIVHSQIKDTQIQVRGRVRNDIQNLYILNNQDKSLVVPEEYLNCHLFKAQKDELCRLLNIQNDSRSQVKWTTIKKMLIDQGYEIKIKRVGTKEASIISTST